MTCFWNNLHHISSKSKSKEWFVNRFKVNGIINIKYWSKSWFFSLQDRIMTNWNRTYPWYFEPYPSFTHCQVAIYTSVHKTMIVTVSQLHLPMHVIPIIAQEVSFTLVHGEVYSIQLYVIKFVTELWQVGGFLMVVYYNYLCNQCLSPLKLWVRIPLVMRSTQYNIMW